MTPTSHAWRGFQKFPIEILNHHITLLCWLHPGMKKNKRRNFRTIATKYRSYNSAQHAQKVLRFFKSNPSRYKGSLVSAFWFMHLGYLWMPEKKALGRTVHVCVFVCLFSMGFPLLCPSLKAPFSLICCVSCPLCLPLFSSAHPITAQWLIACLASKSQCVSLCVCGEQQNGDGDWRVRGCVCVRDGNTHDCVGRGFCSCSQWPWM